MKRAVNLFTSLAAAKASRVCFTLFGLTLMNGQSAVAQSATDVARGRPDLRGLWQAHNPRSPQTVMASFNVIQSGDRFTLQALLPGKPEMTVFDGTFESNEVITGQALDTKSPPNNPRWVPLNVRVRDGNHLELDAGLILTRATSGQAADFNGQRRASLTALPARPFDLNGEWGFGKYRVTIRQGDGEFAMYANGAQQPLYRGHYTSNPIIEGEALLPDSPPNNPQWIPLNLTVESPDQIRNKKLLIYRISKPKSNDIPCDAQNSNHVTDSYATVRGAMASAEKDYKTARCWLTIASDLGFPRAQSMLAALIMQGGDGTPPDYALAFELTRKSAESGDVAGQFQLAGMYQNGKGTAQDAEKARFWLQNAQHLEGLAKINAALTPGGLANGLDMLFGLAGSTLDFDLGMTPSSCFSQDVLGNRVPCK